MLKYVRVLVYCFKMIRVAIFSHYDKNNLIQNYVIYFLQKLSEFAETIIFVSDCDVSTGELEKIRPYIKYAITGRHGEYDFGSFKRGYLYVKENNLLKNCEELLFVNDSNYAPISSFKDMFDKMSLKNLDFWGATENKFENIPPHIQSYFYSFKPSVFNSEVFDNFIKSITKKERKHFVFMKYEVGLTVELEKAGFKWDVYSELSKISELAILRDYKNLIKISKSPFLKRNIVLLKEPQEAYPFFLKKFLNKYTDYDYELIKDDIAFNGQKFSLLMFLSYLRRKIIKVHLKAGRICLFGKWFCLKNNIENF